MYCRYCGKLVPDDSQYCEFCGKQINDSLNEESSINVKTEIIEKCRICEKVFDDNESRIPLETGEMMCEDCAATFREDRKKVEDIDPKNEDEIESILKDVLDVINNDVKMYIKNEENSMYSTEETFDDEQHEDYNFVFQRNESDIIDEIRTGDNIGNQNNVTLQNRTDYMDITDLKEYLEIVVNMEKNIYLQNSLISYMKNRFDILGQKHIFQKPRTPNEISEDGSHGLFILCVILGIPLILIGVKLFHGQAGDPLLGVIMMPFGVIVLLFGVINRLLYLEKCSKLNKEAEKRYAVESEEYKKKICIDNERVQKELIEKAVLSSELDALQKQNENTRKNLDKIYSMGVIFPKYRNLVMVCSIYEYVCSGRCTVLQGHEGAYNILEMEIRLDRIITQLDLIIKQLDVIRNNQYMLYSAIQETNQQVAQLLQSTKYVMDSLQSFQGQAEELTNRIASIEKNSMLSVYQAESVQKELQYMNRMDYLSGKYNNVFFNSPPS